MKNTIVETLKGLELALDWRAKKVEELNTKDETTFVEEKRAELQKEMDEKLNAFIEEIRTEKENVIAKLNKDIEIINELKGEYEAQLAGIEAEEQKVAEEEVSEVVEETDGEEVAVDETEEVKDETPETLPVFENTVANHPFRP